MGRIEDSPKVVASIDKGTTLGQMAFWDGTDWVYTETTELYWDDVNKRVGVGTSSPDTTVQVVGSVKMGDDNTNYASFDTDGELTLAGTARVVKKFHLDPSTVKSGGTSPTAAIIGVTSVLQFSQAVTQSVVGEFHIPNDWDDTTDIDIHIHWAPTNSNAGDVVWDIDYTSLASDNNEVLTAGVTNISVTDSTGSLQDELLETASLTVVSGNIDHEDVFSFQLYRDTSDGADTYESSVSLVRMDIEYTSNKLGTAT